MITLPPIKSTSDYIIENISILLYYHFPILSQFSVLSLMTDVEILMGQWRDMTLNKKLQAENRNQSSFDFSKIWIFIIFNNIFSSFFSFYIFLCNIIWAFENLHIISTFRVVSNHSTSTLINTIGSRLYKKIQGNLEIILEK